MGKDHKEDILKCLKDWRALTLKQAGSLLNGDLQEFEKLTKASVAIQNRLDDLITSILPEKPDKESVTLLQEIQKLQAGLLAELKKGAKELSNAIGELRKNTSALKGYHKNTNTSPRFKSERT